METGYICYQEIEGYATESTISRVRKTFAYFAYDKGKSCNNRNARKENRKLGNSLKSMFSRHL